MPNKPEIKHRGIADYAALAFSTFGVGYLPLAPGTWGSVIGVLIYLGYLQIWGLAKLTLIDAGWVYQQYSAGFNSLTGLLLASFCLIGIWASARAVRLFDHKDPQKIVVDEVMGQLVVFTFVPISISGWLVLAGFILFRVFDIWKPYPVR